MLPQMAAPSASMLAMASSRLRRLTTVLSPIASYQSSKALCPRIDSFLLLTARSPLFSPSPSPSSPCLPSLLLVLLHRLLSLHPPPSLPFLPHKIIIVHDRDMVKTLTTYIPPDVLPSEYGGQANFVNTFSVPVAARPSPLE